tara:strand:+ start:386 stop:958 length:573 start_codon:yes stop_codon:yes gene_type:complete
MTNENLKSTTQVRDNIFDTKYLVDMLELLNNTDFKPNNLANRSTWPLGWAGATHRIFSCNIFHRFTRHLIKHNTNFTLVEMYVKMYEYLEEVFKLKRPTILNSINVNLQFKGMNGSYHKDYGTKAILFMIGEEAKGGQFIIKKNNKEEKITFKNGRIVCFDPTAEHRGLAFTDPYKPRYTVQFLFTEEAI